MGHSRLLNWNALLHSEIEGYLGKKSDAYLHSFPQPAWKEYTKVDDSGDKLRGDEVVRKIRECLRTGMGITRSETQWKVHEACLQAMLPYIYGEEWDLNQGRILKKYNLKEVKQEVLIIMSRRQGKSFSVGMFVAALLLNCPKIRIAVWATAFRLSRALMEIIKNMLARAFQHSYNAKNYEKGESNNERFSFFGPDGTERTVLCLPGTAKVSPSCFLSVVRRCRQGSLKR